MIKGLHHAGITVADLDAAIAFYCDHFGFKVEFEFGWERDTPLGDAAGAMSGEDGSTARAVMLRRGGSFVELFSFETPTVVRTLGRELHQHGISHICLETTDVQADHARLAGEGVRFLSEPIDAGPMTIAYCKDLDGNLVELLQVGDPLKDMRLTTSR